MKYDFKHPAHHIGSVRAKALSAATDILATQGVDNLNLRAIAEKAGIGLASIYHYFSNKEELLLSLAVMGYEDLRRDIIRFQERREFPTPVAAGARAYFGFAQARPALFSLMFSERLMARHESLREAEHKTFLAYQAAVKEDGRFPAAQQANVAVALWALGRGIAAMISSQPDRRLPRELADQIAAGANYLINHSDQARTAPRRSSRRV